MHPELLRALAKARHDDLLDVYPTSRRTGARQHDHSPRFVRARRRVGALLISTGARLIDTGPVELELVHD